MLEKFKDVLTKFTKTCIFTFLVAYLLFHLFNGQNSVVTYIQKKNELEEIESELAILERERNSLQNKVQRLYPQSLDADLLDEQYRRATGMVRENEVIYFYD
jgi:cell division protein FtsB